MVAEEQAKDAAGDQAKAPVHKLAELEYEEG